MENLSINFVIPHAQKTGGTRVIFTFADRLSLRGHNVKIIAYHYENWFNFRKDSNVEVIDLSRTLKGKIAIWPYYFDLFNQRNKIFKRLTLGISVSAFEAMARFIPKSDVNISTWCMMSLPVLLKNDGSIPIWHMQHLETIFFERNQDMKLLVELMIRSRINKIVNSSWLESEIRCLTTDGLRKIFPGIDHSIFNGNSCISREKKVFRILTLGKKGWKNGSYVIEAVKRVSRKYENKIKVELHIYGTNLDWVPKEKFIHKHLNINDFELAELYRFCDCTITASDFESFPLPPLEAMACGSAVITTRYGTEDFAQDMFNSLIVRARDVDSISVAVEKLIQDAELKANIIKNGMETAKNFNWEKQTDEYERILQGLKKY